MFFASAGAFDQARSAASRFALSRVASMCDAQPPALASTKQAMRKCRLNMWSLSGVVDDGLTNGARSGLETCRERKHGTRRVVQSGVTDAAIDRHSTVGNARNSRPDR